MPSHERDELLGRSAVSAVSAKDSFGRSYGLVSGSVIANRYEVGGLIAQGGMAGVFRGLHCDLGQPLAIKALHPQFLHVPGATDRFLDEARILASIRHRNVVRCWDVGTTDDGIPYLVMDMLDGESLAKRLDRETLLPQEEAVDIARACLSGLGAAHAAGIIHRDVKPDNLILVRDDDGLCPKLIDFGISHVQRERAALQPRYRTTNFGTLMGTPEYMSPEQARGLSKVDARSDVYAVGILLYEMLTGCPPFVSENIGDLIVLVTTTEPPDLRQVDETLDPDLCALIMRALSRNPEDRFASAQEMRDALGRFRSSGFSSGMRDREAIVKQSSFPPPTNAVSLPAGVAAGSISAGNTPVSSLPGVPRPAGAGFVPSSRNDYASGSSLSELEAHLGKRQRLRRRVLWGLAVVGVLAAGFFLLPERWRSTNAGLLYDHALSDGVVKRVALPSGTRAVPPRTVAGATQTGKSATPHKQPLRGSETQEPGSADGRDENKHASPLVAQDPSGTEPIDAALDAPSGDVSTGKSLKEANKKAARLRRRRLRQRAAKRRAKLRQKKQQRAAPNQVENGRIIALPDF